MSRKSIRQRHGMATCVWINVDAIAQKQQFFWKDNVNLPFEIADTHTHTQLWKSH